MSQVALRLLCRGHGPPEGRSSPGCAPLDAIVIEAVVNDDDVQIENLFSVSVQCDRLRLACGVGRTVPLFHSACITSCSRDNAVWEMCRQGQWAKLAFTCMAPHFPYCNATTRLGTMYGRQPCLCWD